MKEFTHKPQQDQMSSPRKLKTEWVIFISDIWVALLSLYVTLRLLLGKDIQTLQMSFIVKHCLVFALISFGLFSLIRSHQGGARYITLDKISGILGCGVLANLFYHPLMLLMGSLPPLTPVINTILFMIGLLLPRLLVHFWKVGKIKANSVERVSKISVIVIGYNEQVDAYLREKKSVNQIMFPYHIEGILLNNPLRADGLVLPFPVLGTIKDFVSIVQKLSLEGREPKRFLIVEESLSYIPLRQILLRFQAHGILSLRIDVSPASQKVTLQPLCLEDFLAKPDSQSFQNSEWQEVQAFIDATCILITGVNDPVMHQLAHHIVNFYPKHLIMVDSSERSLAALKMKFDQLYPDVVCDYVLASITDHAIMDHLIKTHHPQLIIHGDRITHPDFVAQNLFMAVQKNIVSPLRLAKTIQQTENCLFVLVNAQSPTVVTRLITTLVTQKFQELDGQDENAHRFLVVNSSDVWNNLDSKTSFWADQLSQGLKITIPSPDSYSCLLSAQEAAQTILGAIAKAYFNKDAKGQILYLSGHEPSRFLELIRTLALFKGLIPEIDTKIHFSGEAISLPLIDTTNLLPSLTPGVMMGQTSIPPQDEDLLAKLSAFFDKGKIDKIISLLEEVRVSSENCNA